MDECHQSSKIPSTREIQAPPTKLAGQMLDTSGHLVG